MTPLFVSLLLLEIPHLLYIESLNTLEYHQSHYILTSVAIRTDHSCLNLIKLLINILLYRTKVYMLKNNPIHIDHLENWIINLNNITIWGFDEFNQVNINNDDQFNIEQEEIWLHSNKNQPNSDVSIQEWMMKRDKKLCDVYKIKFSLGFSKNILLTANWLLLPNWNYLNTENNLIHVQFINLYFNVSLHLFINQNGAVRFEIDHLKITNLSNINLSVFRDLNHNTTYKNVSRQSENAKFIENFTFQWLLNENTLREILFYFLESTITNILNTNIAQIQNNFALNKSVDCKV
ncbi:unnamed protein product [Heterobilharzia americana]|nr:unnamed protein product [Heterobilharzia americana]